MKTVEMYMEEIAKKRRQLQTISIFCFALLIAITVLFFYRIRVVAFVTYALLLLFYFLWFRRQRQSYSDLIAEAQLRFGLCKNDTDAKYIGRTGPNASEFDQMGILPIQQDEHGLLLRQGFAYQEDGLGIRGWEIAFHFLNGSNAKNKYDFLSGSLIEIQLADDPGNLLMFNDIVLSERHRVAFTDRLGFSPVQAADLKDIFVYSDHPENINPEIFEKISTLLKAAPRISALRLRPGCVLVFMQNRFYTTNVKVRDLPTQKQLESNPLPEIEPIKAFCLSLHAPQTSSPQDNA
ncbi:MAG: hypothetical protein IJ719_12280 [Clostridia bacterium]|nr:hypothetical protein [Clostridia bacterium]